MKKFYLIILFAFLASFGSYITAAEKTITYTFTTKDWNATDQEGNAANWVSGGSASSTLDKTKGIPVYKGETGANATSPISFNNIKKVVLFWGTSSKAVGNIVLTVGGTDQTAQTVIKNQENQSYEVTFDTPVNGYVKFTVNCTISTIFIKSVAVTYEEEAAADQVAAPTADPEPGTYNGATIVTLTSPEGTTINGLLNDETIVSTSNTYSKELIAVDGEKTTYTFEVWTENDGNDSDPVSYTYIIDPSYVPDSYILCTDIKYLTPGTNVIFVGSNAKGKENKVMTDFDGSIRKADATNVKVSEDGYTLENIGNAVVFTVAYDGSATDNYKYSFYDSSNYLGSGESAKNTMSNQTAKGVIIPDKAKWSISLDAVNYYNATIEAKEYFTDNDKIDYPFLRYNSGSPRFACYRLKFAAGLLRIYFNAKTSGVEKVALTDTKAKVYGANGNIVVEAEAAADVNVYNAAGMLVAAQKVGAGRTNIALAKGFYVVRAGNTVTKVAVR